MLLPLLLLLLLPPSLSTSGPCGLLGECPAAATAGAGHLLQHRPFTVVWNMPTAKCHKRHNVQLELEALDIVVNPEQHFQGEKMSIFYRDRLGKYPYVSHDGREVNGGIPQLGDPWTHLSLTLTQLSALLRPNFSGVAVIDWEEWQPLWENNFDSKKKYRTLSKLLVRQERPELTGGEVTRLARQAFEWGARTFMEETLRGAVSLRPGGLWGFYGFPYCFNKHKRRTDADYTGRCHNGTRLRNERLAWLWTGSTALFPSIYLPRRLAGSADAALMVRHRLLEALRVAERWPHGNHATPVLPYARLAFSHSLRFLNKTDLEHTLGESASLGAAGVVLWGDLTFAKSKQQCLLLKRYIHDVLAPFLRSLNSHTQSCSLQRCHGNGRCARRHAASGHTFASASAAAHLSSRGAFHTHFLCHCYPGWTGQECDQREGESGEWDD